MKQLEMTEWDALSSQEQEEVARQVDKALPAAFEWLGLRRFTCGTTTHSVAQWRWQNLAQDEGIENESVVFSLVPGGEVELGLDAGLMERLSPAMRADWDSRSEDYQIAGQPAPSLEEHLAATSSPLRRVTLAPLLVEAEARELKEPILTECDEVREAVTSLASHWKGVESWTSQGATLRVEVEQGRAVRAWRLMQPTRDELTQTLALDRFRLLTSDEWEHACAAGARTLFRWGEPCPLEFWPEATDPSVGSDKYELVHAHPNAWGLTIANHPHRWEVVRETAIMRGDGGCASCGGAGLVAQWLPLASSYLWHETEALDKEQEGVIPIQSLVRRAFPLAL